MADVSFVHSSAGYVSLMKSDEMRGVLHEYADGIEAAASASIAADKGEPLHEAPYAAFDFDGRSRAGVRVQTHNRHADYAERKHGHLQNAAGV